MLKDILLGLSLSVCDIFKVDQVQLKELSSSGDFDVNFRGRPLADFDHVIYLNTPVRGYDTDDEIFATTEFEAALRAVLKIGGVKLVNKGLAACYHRGLVTPIVICNQLEKVGWRIPSVHYAYSKHRFPTFYKALVPDPMARNCYRLYLTVYDYFIQPGIRVHFNQQVEFLKLVSATQEFMRRQDYDYLILGFFKKDGDFFIYSHFTEIPPDTDGESLKKLLWEVLG